MIPSVLCVQLCACIWRSGCARVLGMYVHPPCVFQISRPAVVVVVAHLVAIPGGMIPLIGLVCFWVLQYPIHWSMACTRSMYAHHRLVMY